MGKTTALDTIGSAAGAVDPGVKTGTEIVIPRIYGRVMVDPVVLFARTLRESDSTYHNVSTVQLTSDHASAARGAVDCIMALGQAGLVIQGVQRGGGDYVGLKKNADGTWTQANSTTVLQAIRRLSRFDLTYPPGYNPSSPNGISSPSQPVPYGIEIITGAASPWGLRQARSTSSPDLWNSITGGSVPPAWAYLNGTDAEGLTYANLSTIRFEQLALNAQGKIDPIKYLVDGVGGGPDCNPSAAIRDVLVNLMGFEDAQVITDEGPDGEYASSFDAYAAAMASTFALNCAMTGKPDDILNEFCEAVNAVPVQLPGGYMKILALSDTPVGSYVPCSAAVVIGANDIQRGSLLEVEEREEADCPNTATISYKDAAKKFEDATYTVRDDFDIAASSERPGPTRSNRWITSSAHAQAVAQVMVRQALSNRRTYVFDLDQRYSLLQPGDLVIVGDVGLPATPARIVSLDEDDDWNLQVVAQEWSGSTTALPTLPELPREALGALPDALAPAAEILGQQAAAVADGKAEQDLSDVADGSVLERHLADDSVTVAKLNVSTLSAITANLGTVNAGQGRFGGYTESGGVPTVGAFIGDNPGGPNIKVPADGVQVGKYRLSSSKMLVGACSVYRDGSPTTSVFLGANPLNISTPTIIDRGSSATQGPRYYLNLTLTAATSGVEIAVTPAFNMGNGVSSPYQPVTLWGGVSGINIGLWSGSAWVDMNSNTLKWHIYVQVHTAYG